MKASVAHGALLGSCVGDAAGAVLEFLGHKPTKKEVDLALTLPGGGKHKVAPGQVTDDSELCLSLASALVEAGEEDRKNSSTAPPTWKLDIIAKHYAQWIESKPFDCGEATQLSLGCFTMDDYAHVATTQGLGNAMTLAAKKLNNKSQSNGSLMRCIPLAIWGHQLDDATLIPCIQQEVKLSHSHPVPVLTTVCYVLAISHLMTRRGDNKGAFKRAQDWLSSSLVTASNGGSGSEDEMKAIQTVMKWLDEAQEGLIAPYGPDSQQGWVRIAFAHAFRHLYKGTPFMDALKETLAGGGDTDTNAAIVCGLLGAVCGREGLPQSMLSGVYGADTSVGRPRPESLHPLMYLDLVDRLLAIAPSSLTLKDHDPIVPSLPSVSAPQPQSHSPTTAAINNTIHPASKNRKRTVWSLVPTCTVDSQGSGGVVIELGASGEGGDSVVVGRNVQPSLTDKRLSRQHLTFQLPKANQGEGADVGVDGPVLITLHGSNPSHVRKASTAQWIPLEKGLPFALFSGDEVCLLMGLFSYRLVSKNDDGCVEDGDASQANLKKRARDGDDTPLAIPVTAAAAVAASSNGDGDGGDARKAVMEPPSPKRSKSDVAGGGDGSPLKAATLSRTPTMVLMENSDVKDSDVESVLEILPATPRNLVGRALVQSGNSVEIAIELILTNAVRSTSSLSAAKLPIAPKGANAGVSGGADVVDVDAPSPAEKRTNEKRESLQLLIAQLKDTMASSAPNTATDGLLAKLQQTLDELDHEKQKADAEALAQQQVIQMLVSEKDELVKDLSNANQRKMHIEDEDRLYMTGEKEIRQSNTMRIYNLYPKRQFSNDAGAMHFRIAESQFHRLFKSGSNATVVKVEYVVNPQHVRAFENKRLELAASMDWDDTKPILAFHGTAETNISSIIKKNFSIAKVGSATDAGWYGAGCYFSEDPGLSMGYTRGATKFLLCQILLGRVYKCPGMMNGAPLKDGYDSHQSPCGKELVIFDPAQILPYYVVHYSIGGHGVGGFGGFGWGAKKKKGGVAAAGGVDYYHDVELYRDEPLDPEVATGAELGHAAAHAAAKHGFEYSDDDEDYYG